MPNEFVARNGIISLANSIVTGSVTATQGFTGSLFGTASWATNAATSSFILNAVSASFAATASSADNFNVRGTLTATTIVAQTITSSTDFVTGSTRFGSLLTNTHVFSGSVTMNPGGLFVSSSGLVGIGTTSPAYKLDVTGDINFTSTLKFGGVSVIDNTSTDVYANIRVIRSLSTSNDGMYIGYNSTGTTGAHLRFYANGTNERMRIDAASGSVGIGTTSPAAILHSVGSGIVNIVQSSNTVSYTQYYNTSTGTGGTSDGLTVGNNGADAYVFNREAANLILGTSATEALRINSSGNVGIGTTSPSEKLHIYGVGNQLLKIENSGTYLINFGLSSNEGYIGSTNATPLNIITNNSSRIYIKTDGNVGIGTTSPTARLHISGTTINDLFRIDAVATTALYVSASGNVGIGITNPRSRLSVGGSGGVDDASITSFYGNYSVLGEVSTVAYRRSAWHTLYVFETGSSATNAVLVEGNKPVIFNAGNVGIGTTTPTLATLQVNGNIRATSFTGSLSGSLFGTASWASNAITSSYVLNAVSASFATTATAVVATVTGTNTTELVRGNMADNDQFRILVGGTATNAGYAEIATADDGTEPIYVRQYTGVFSSLTRTATLLDGSGNTSFPGNVGIGTTNPGYPLEIASTNTVSLAYQRTGVSAKKWGFDSDNSNTYWYNITDNIRSLTLANGGNVGIGTTSPATRLDVNGRLSFTSASISTIFAERNGNYHVIYSPAVSPAIYMGNASDPGNYYDNTNHYFRSAGGGTTYAVINSAGNVGIGTTSPGVKLEISSSAAEAFKITGGTVNGLYSTFFNGTITPLFLGFGGTLSSTATNNDGVIRYNGSYNLIFTSDGTERMRLNSSGNVGINCTGANAKLEVVATSGEVFRADAASGAYRIVATQTGVNMNGNVGIGTTSPTSRFQSNNSSTYNSTTPSGAIIASNLSGGNAIVDIGVDTTYLGYIQSRNILDTTAYALLLNPIGGNVGIGTTSPATKLDVDGTAIAKLFGGSGSFPTYAQFDAYMSATNATYGNNYAYYGMHRAGAVSWQLGMISSSFVIAKGGGASQYTLWSDRYFAITDTGNVGIGTTSPAYKLEVSGGNIAYKPSVGGNLRLGDDETYGTSGTGRYITVGFGSMANGGNRIFAHNTGQDGIFIASTTGQGVFFRVNGGASNDVSITSAGNVGIGTTSPTATLTVSKAASNFMFDLENATETDFKLRTYNSGSSGSGTAVFTQGLYYGVNENGAIKFHRGGGGTDGFLSFTTTGTERLRINSAGNVGIGTTSPATKLDVSGSTRTGGSVFGKSILSAAPGSATYYKLATLPVSDTSTYDHIVIEGVINGTWQAADSFPFKILLGNRGSNTNHFFFGPGTAVSGDKASVVVYVESGGSRTVWLKFDASYFTLMSVNVISSINVTTFPDFPTGTPTGTLNWSSATNSPLTYYDMANSRFGIGTTTPSGRLTVAQSVNSGTANVLYLSNPSQTGTTAAAINFINADSVIKASINAAVYGNDYMTFNVGSNTERVRINADGNVGIGTTSVPDKLTVAGNLFLSGSGRNVWLGNNVDSGDRLRLHQNGIYSYIDFHSGDLLFRADTTTKVSFSPTGTITAAGDVVAYGSPSDISLKTNIKPLEGALDKITKLQGVSFTWKEDTDTSKLAGIKDDIGFIAQEVQEILPDLVRKNDNGLLSLRDKGITALLVEAIKEQQQQIDDLKYLLQTINK